MGKIRAVLGFALAGLFLYLALHNVEWGQVGLALGSANYLYVVPATLCTLAGYLLRTLRWGRILRPVRHASFARLFPILIVGFAANNVLPARVGELVRAYGLGRREDVSKTMALATILVERVCDGLTLLFFLGLVLLLFPAGAKGAEVRTVASISVIFFVGAAGSLVVLRRWPVLAETVLGWLTRPLPRRLAAAAQRMMGNFVLGLGVLARPGDVLVVGAGSLLVWSCEAASYFLVMRAFGLPLNPLQQVLASVFVLVFVNLGIMLPSAPGYIGTFQFFARMAMGAFGVGGGVAFAFAVVSHALQYVLVTSLGLVYFLRDNLALPINGEEVVGAAVPTAEAAKPKGEGRSAPSTIEG